MQRPVMNPMFHEDLTTSASPQRASLWRRVLAGVIRLLTWLVRLLLAKPFALRRGREDLRIEDASPVQRFLRGVLYRLALVPVLTVLTIVALVYAGTHPPAVTATSDPATQGIYFDPVTFLSNDNVRLDAWLVPAINAETINEQHETALRKKQPAVVLVHDYGSTRSQLLPLVRPLHESGIVVLAVGLRGCGTSGGAAQTFGLRESDDVQAAVEMLRRRHFIDGDRIGLLGVGTGATAALLAADRDPRIRALVLEDPLVGPEQVIADRIGPRQSWLAWMRPFSKWAFEISYNVNSDELRIDRYAALMADRPVYMVDGDSRSPACVRPPAVKQIQHFLTKYLTESETTLTQTN